MLKSSSICDLTNNNPGGTKMHIDTHTGHNVWNKLNEDEENRKEKKPFFRHAKPFDIHMQHICCGIELPATLICDICGTDHNRRSK